MEDRGVSLIQIGMGSQFMKQELESHTHKKSHTHTGFYWSINPVNLKGNQP